MTVGSQLPDGAFLPQVVGLVLVLDVVNVVESCDDKVVEACDDCVESDKGASVVTSGAE